MAERIRVLHVDDEPRFVELAAERLAAEDDRFDVVTATSGAEGLDRLGEGDIDCIVSDYEMPGQDGIEFLKAVRADYPDLPFVLFTGEGSESIAGEAISAGVDDYMQKSTGADQFEVLANRVANLVEQARARTSYREVFQKATVGLTIHDPGGGLIDANERYCELLGYSREELVDLTVADLSTGVDGYTAERARERVTAAAAGERQRFEWLEETKDGDHVWVDVGLRAAELEGRRRVLASVVDITDRKARERELEQAERRYAALLEHANDAITWVTFEDDRPIVQDANPAFRELFGPADGDVVGRDIDELVAGADRREEARELSARVRAGEAMSGELTRDTVDGEREFLWQAVPIEDPDTGAVESGFAIYTDITDRKARERELERTTRRLEAIVENTTEAIYIKDADGHYRFVNESAAELFGMDPEAVIGRTDTELFDPDSAAAIRERDERVMATGEPLTDETTRYIDGEKHVLLNDKYPYRDEDGEVIGVMGISRDITDRKERERALRRQNERLEEFADILSHDLRNPLNVAEGRLELARETYGDDDDLVAAAESLDRIRSLVDDLLTVARTGEPLDEPEVVALADAVDRCWGNVETGGATLELSTAARVRADPSRLQQLFENLFSNAVQHGATAEEEAVTITVGDLEEGFYVADDGRGVPADEREQVFERRYSTADDGTGLGLTIVREVAEAHGWAVELVESDAGGARFEITGVDVVD